MLLQLKSKTIFIASKNNILFRTDYLFAKAMGYTGSQLPDSAGVSVGLTADKQVEEYSYLNGRAKHYKLVGEGHGTGPSHDKVREVVKAALLA